MGMTSYNGSAVLVAGEAEVAVEAHLVRDDDPDRLGGWGGFVDCDPTVLGDLLGKHVVLRLPDGTKGTVLIMGGGRVEGSGNPPFDN